jgi:hypothetical protein
MAHRAIPADTDRSSFDVLVACWQAMSVAERVALVDQMHVDVELLAVAGIRATRPDLAGSALRRELASRRFGAAVADEAYRHLLTE